MEKDFETRLKIRKFFKEGRPIKYKAKETIIRADDEPSGVYYLVEGFVKIYSLTQDGKELIYNIYRLGSYFPAAWLLAEERNTRFFEALTPVTVFRVSKKEVLEFLQKNPDALMELIKRISTGLVYLTHQTEVLVYGTALNKVSFVLLQLALRFGKKYARNKVQIIFPLTHQLISGLAGLARETVTLVIDQLKKNGVIFYLKRSSFVVNIKALENADLETLSSENVLV